MNEIYPTKGNLISVKRSLALAKTGHELLDKKKNILLKELFSLTDKAGEIEAQLCDTMKKAYMALRIANENSGLIEDFTKFIPTDDSIRISNKSVMGVDLPVISSESQSARPYYGLENTTSALDEAYLLFRDAKNICIKLSEMESAVYRLAVAVKKTQKRANSLKNMIIPNYEKTVKTINEVLEEKEREEFSRLKVIKRKKGKIKGKTFTGSEN